MGRYGKGRLPRVGGASSPRVGSSTDRTGEWVLYMTLVGYDRTSYRTGHGKLSSTQGSSIVAMSE